MFGINVKNFLQLVMHQSKCLDKEVSFLATIEFVTILYAWAIRKYINIKGTEYRKLQLLFIKFMWSYFIIVSELRMS
jgi:hypothetical protein